MNELFTAVEAKNHVAELRKGLNGVYNLDLYKLLDNMDAMVTDLSKLEVKHRRNNKAGSLMKQREKITQAIDYFNKMLLMYKLMY